MKMLQKPGIFLLVMVVAVSCFKEIDTVPIPRTVEATFTVQQSIKRYQSYYRFYKNAVLEVDTSLYTLWDMAFESAGSGNRVLPGWASSSTVVKTGKYEFNELDQDMILDLIENSDEWTFDDPAYLNEIDSLSLRDWENGEIYLQSRGVEKDNYYLIRFVSRSDEAYTFQYVSAQHLDDVKEATVIRSESYNYVYFSYKTESTIVIDPPRANWDIEFTPYLGWWESFNTGEFSPYVQSGALINNETGVRIARVFDTAVSFKEIDYATVSSYEFTDMKGAIGSNWKLLGPVGSVNLYIMDSTKKYILKKIDSETKEEMYFKLQIVAYKLDGEDHHPTVEFKYLGPE